MLVNTGPVDARAFPWVGFVQARFPKQSPSVKTIGSGALIGPTVVLTAGHVVYEFAPGGFADQMSVTFGGPGGLVAPVKTMRTTGQWVSTDSRIQGGLSTSAFDFGVIVLERPVDSAITPVQFETMATGVLDDRMLNVLGYPGQPPSGTLGGLFGAHSRPSSVNDTRIFYPLNTLAGMSGGPVYDVDATTKIPTIRGIHTSIVPTIELGLQGSALRITENVKTLVLQWLATFRPV